MWGCDLTPLYDPSGGRLLCFTAFLPLGLRLKPLQRPKDPGHWMRKMRRVAQKQRLIFAKPEVQG